MTTSIIDGPDRVERDVRDHTRAVYDQVAAAWVDAGRDPLPAIREDCWFTGPPAQTILERYPAVYVGVNRTTGTAPTEQPGVYRRQYELFVFVFARADEREATYRACYAIVGGITAGLLTRKQVSADTVLSVDVRDDYSSLDSITGGGFLRGSRMTLAVVTYESAVLPSGPATETVTVDVGLMP